MAMSIQLPDAASLQRTEAVVANIEKVIRSEPAVQNIVALVGLDLLSQSSSTNGATVFLNLKPWEERSKHDGLDSIAARINGKLFAMKDANAFGFNLPEVPGLGVTAGVEVNLQNRSGQDIRQFAGKVNEFRQAVNQLPASGALNSTFRASVPQVYVTVDRTAAKARGVNLTDLFATMQAFLSSLYISDFNLFGKTPRAGDRRRGYRQSPNDRPAVRTRRTTR
jgi:multidrug efflux pump subunit AcrB